MADPQPDIQLFNQTNLALPFDESSLPEIAMLLSQGEDCSYSFVEVVYVDEPKIIAVNKEYLDRDYVTDIITFRYDDESTNDDIEGTLFCCAPRILEQAEEFEASPKQEFLRIFIHGLLHLAGYDDQSDEQKEQMTAKENHYLDLAEAQ